MGFIKDGAVSIDLTVNEEKPTQTVGDLFIGTDGIYQYVKCEGGATAGDFMLIDENGDATELTTTNSGSLPQAVGVAVASLTDEYHGFVWRGVGTYEAFVANGVTAGQLTTTATAGVAGTGGDTIIGARNVDTGVTSTRVTIFAATLMATNT